MASAHGDLNTSREKKENISKGWEKKENISEVWEKSAAVDSAEPNSFDR